MARALAFVLAALAAAGCSNGSMSMGTPDMARRAPTDHAPLWGAAAATTHVVQSAPEVYTVVYAGDPYATQIEGFINWMLTSDYWTGSLKEYGVGAGKSMGIITLPGPAPAALDDAGITTLVKSVIANGSVPNPNPNTNLAFFFPQSTVVTTSGARSCAEIGGYHFRSQTTNPVVYSAIFECTDPTGEADGGSLFDGVTKAASHEIAEAATDPHNGDGWYSTEGQEIGDLCNVEQNLAFDSPGDATHPPARYWVERNYSFANAKLGNVDPCLPVPFTRPFFGITTEPGSVTVKSAFGATEHFSLEPFAFGDVGKMHWQVVSSAFQPVPLEGTVEAGDTVDFSLVIPKGTPPGAQEVDLAVEAEKGGTFMWPLYVHVQ